MKVLTAKQQRVFDLFDAGRSKTQVAAEIGVSVSVVTKQLKVARAKLGIKTSQAEGRAKLELHVKDPETFAARLDAGTEPEKLIKLREALEDAGISGKAAEAYIARLKRRYPGVMKESRSLKNAELTELLGQKIHMALAAMDEHVVMEASYRDLALGTTALIEKMQLLKGQPTAITSDLERKKLIELTPLLIAEAQRRGITIEGTSTIVQEAA